MSQENHTLAAQVHREDGSFWAEIPELPGCFASGATMDELREALDESVALYLADSGESLPAVHVA